MSSAAVIDFQLADPRQNLPPHLARKRGESNLIAAFRRTYREAQTFFSSRGIARSMNASNSGTVKTMSPCAGL